MLTNPPLQGPSEPSADSDKKLSQADEILVPSHRYTPLIQGRGEPSADNDKMLRLADQEVLETLGSKDNNPCSQVCSTGGCIIPEIVAAVEEFKPSVNFYTVIRDPSKMLVSTMRSAHLYGFQAHCLTVPCKPGDTQFFEATHDYEAQLSSILSFGRGDIIRKHRQISTSWAQGSLGKRTGQYPKGYVRPCTFQSPQSCILSSALRGPPLINEVTSKYLFAASGRLHCTKRFV